MKQNSKQNTDGKQGKSDLEKFHLIKQLEEGNAARFYAIYEGHRNAVYRAAMIQGNLDFLECDDHWKLGTSIGFGNFTFKLDTPDDITEARELFRGYTNGLIKKFLNSYGPAETEAL